MSPKPSNDDLDLHGFTVAEAIERFVQHYNVRVDNNQFGCWKVIHGYGSTGQGGVIRLKLHAFLDQHLDKLRYEAGDDYGDPGWTFVYPKVRLPDQRERMVATILSFCAEGKFVTTRWTVVLNAGSSGTTQAQVALEKLCQTYWYPLYAYVRRQGHSPEDAQDLTQDFFAKLIAKHYLGDVDRSKGKFRSFLLASLKHFLANEWDKSHAQKRGGGHTFIALDAQTAESRYHLEPVDTMTADKIYERRWVLTLLDEVLKRLREEYMGDGKAMLFDQLKETLTGERSSIPYAEIGQRLGMTEGAVKVAVHRLRQHYREQLRAEIAETVANPGEVEEELRHLFAVLSG